MIEMTLTAENQITLDKSLLEHLGVKAGEKIAIQKLPDGSIKINASKKRRSIMELVGSLQGKTDVKLSIEEINQAIADSYVKHGMRGVE
jgi:antitoxin component of MazEF toxin-antitoxin module